MILPLTVGSLGLPRSQHCHCQSCSGHAAVQVSPRLARIHPYLCPTESCSLPRPPARAVGQDDAPALVTLPTAASHTGHRPGSVRARAPALSVPVPGWSPRIPAGCRCSMQMKGRAGPYANQHANRGGVTMPRARGAGLAVPRGAGGVAGDADEGRGGRRM